MKVIELNHVAIHVEDVEKSVAFYRDVLGLRPKARPAFDFPGAWFYLGEDHELHIIGIRSKEVPVASAPRGAHFALQVDSVDSFAAKFQELAVVHRPIKNRPDGAKQLFLADPDGYYIELTEYSS
ncbi:VOC family protein [Rapidithrix thailandica]|uniref:VOC family protein n=1 Tax=Rapidithrix thailandica TaxID=413964 RepID=A0AAW9S9F4_9BACT